jgi:hypothetical protein
VKALQRTLLAVTDDYLLHIFEAAKIATFSGFLRKKSHGDFLTLALNFDNHPAILHLPVISEE